jgi:hypothetical protein
MTENEIILHDYLREIEKYYKLGIAKEHSYRSTLQTMLPRLVQGVTAVNEPKRVACGAPDYAVLRSFGGNLLTIGYIEAKDIGVSLDKIEKDEQLKRYLYALDNLILTDYLEFRWYINGEKQMTSRLATPYDRPLDQKLSSITCMLFFIHRPIVCSILIFSRLTSHDCRLLQMLICLVSCAGWVNG